MREDCYCGYICLWPPALFPHCPGNPMRKKPTWLACIFRHPSAAVRPDNLAPSSVTGEPLVLCRRCLQNLPARQRLLPPRDILHYLSTAAQPDSPAPSPAGGEPPVPCQRCLQILPTRQRLLLPRGTLRRLSAAVQPDNSAPFPAYGLPAPYRRCLQNHSACRRLPLPRNIPLRPADAVLPCTLFALRCTLPSSPALSPAHCRRAAECTPGSKPICGISFSPAGRKNGRFSGCWFLSCWFSSRWFSGCWFPSCRPFRSGCCRENSCFRCMYCPKSVRPSGRPRLCLPEWIRQRFSRRGAADSTHTNPAAIPGQSDNAYPWRRRRPS